MTDFLFVLTSSLYMHWTVSINIQSLHTFHTPRISALLALHNSIPLSTQFSIVALPSPSFTLRSYAISGAATLETRFVLRKENSSTRPTIISTIYSFWFVSFIIINNNNNNKLVDVTIKVLNKLVIENTKFILLFRFLVLLITYRLL